MEYCLNNPQEAARAYHYCWEHHVNQAERLGILTQTGYKFYLNQLFKLENVSSEEELKQISYDMETSWFSSYCHKNNKDYPKNYFNMTRINSKKFKLDSTKYGTNLEDLPILSIEHVNSKFSPHRC